MSNNHVGIIIEIIKSIHNRFNNPKILNPTLVDNELIKEYLITSEFYRSFLTN